MKATLAIAILIFAFILEPNTAARVAIAALTSLFLTPIVWGLIGTQMQQAVSNVLLTIGVLTFITVPMMPEVSVEGWLLMLVVSPILCFLAYKLDRHDKPHRAIKE